MPKSKKEVVPDKEIIEPPEFVVEDLEDLKMFLEVENLNPLEKTMAVELLLHSYKFIPQYSIYLPEGWTIDGRKFFIADFYLPDFNIIIETEGKIHENTVNEDRNRFNALTSLGYRIFRFSWDDVMKNNEKYDVFSFVEKLILFPNSHLEAERTALTDEATVKALKPEAADKNTPDTL